MSLKNLTKKIDPDLTDTISDALFLYLEIFVGVYWFKARPARRRVPFSCPDCIWDAYLREKHNFLRRNPKFGAKLAITWENEPF